MLSPQTKIAIISLQAYNLFRTDSAVVVGGAEVQLKQLATLLQKHYGCQIRFICLANESGIKKFDGLELACIPRSLGQLAKVNAIQQALRDYAPDFVFQRGWGLETFLAAQHAKKHGAKFVYMAACVWDVERPTLRGWLNWRRALYWLGLKKADAVVAQSQFQQEAFLNNFHIQSRIIRSFQPQPEPVSADKNTLLWVGRANPVKRPKLFIDLAERLPDIPCVMILNASRDQAYFDALQERAHCLPNLRFIPYVPHDQIMPYFHRACLFVNTSTTDEGFPNTYLQAFRTSTPVMALAADPDGLIRENNMGFVANDDLPSLQKAINARFSDADWVRQTGANGANYLHQNHNPDKLVEQWGQMLESLQNS